MKRTGGKNLGTQKTGGKNLGTQRTTLEDIFGKEKQKKRSVDKEGI